MCPPVEGTSDWLYVGNKGNMSKKVLIFKNRGGMHSPEIEEDGTCFCRADTWVRPCDEILR